MPLPPPKILLLNEAASYLAERCGVAVDEAKRGLIRAVLDHAVPIFHEGGGGERIDGFKGTETDWENSAMTGDWRGTIDGTIVATPRQARRRAINVVVPRLAIDRWLAAAVQRSPDNSPRPAPAADDESESSAGGNAPRSEDGVPEPVYGTGLPGRPTSWHLIERECRQRWQDGERHPGFGAGGESPAKWARVLIEWFGKTHRNAPTPKEKTLASNKLPGLLRELAAR